MRTLNEIVTAVRDGERPDYEELRYAICALDALGVFNRNALMRLAEAVIHVPAHAALRIQHLEARLTEAERDAARYRWLRGGSGPQSVRWSRWSVQHWTGSFWATVQSIGMDVAIDAAMFAEQQISQSTADSASHRENERE